MGLFGALIRTVVNVATLPVAIVKDVVTMGGVAVDRDEPYTAEALETLKREAEDDE